MKEEDESFLTECTVRFELAFVHYRNHFVEGKKLCVIVSFKSVVEFRELELTSKDSTSPSNGFGSNA